MNATILRTVYLNTLTGLAGTKGEKKNKSSDELNWYLSHWLFARTHTSTHHSALHNLCVLFLSLPLSCEEWLWCRAYDVMLLIQPSESFKDWLLSERPHLEKWPFLSEKCSGFQVIISVLLDSFTFQKAAKPQEAFWCENRAPTPAILQFNSMLGR